MKIDICIGIENHYPDAIRMICLDVRAVEQPWPIELRRFNDFESFHEYWEELCVNYGEMYIATEFPGLDTFGLFSWLEDLAHVSVEFFTCQEGVFAPQHHRHKVPNDFYSSYELAISCLYRRNAASISKSLISEVSRVQDELTDLAMAMERLSAALKPESTNYCPF